MARRTADLFLQIGGSADGLTTAAKAGRTALLNLGTTATDIQAELDKAFSNLDTKGVENSAKEMERTFNRTFDNIRANARKVMDAPSPAAATQILNVSGAERAAKAAEVEAVAMRKLADASVAVAAKAGEAGAEERILAVGFGAAAAQAEQQAAALREQADVLGKVAAEAGIVADADEDANKRIVKGTGQASIAKAEFQHVLRSASDSFAAGLPLTQIFTMELGRLAEAAAFYGQSMGGTKEEDKNFVAGATEAGEASLATGEMLKKAGEHASGMGAKLAAVGEFMGGPWGLAATMAISVLAPFIAKLFETDEAAEKALAAMKEFEQHELSLPSIIDATTGRLKDQTEAMRELAKVAREVIPSQIGDAETDAKMARNDAFIAARKKVADEGHSRSGPKDAELNRVILDAGGSAKALNDGIQAMLPRRSDLQDLARVVADAYARETLAIEKRTQLKGQQAAYGIVGKGGTLLTPDVVKHAADVAAATTPVEKAQLHVSDLEALIAKVGAKPTSTAQQAQMAKLQAELIAARLQVSRLHDQGHDGDQAGRQISLGDAEGIVHGIGGRITSERRSTAEQQRLWDKYQAYKAGTGPWAPLAAKPGTSAHEKGEALDVAKGGGMTLAKLVEAFREKGVHLTEKLDEGDHFHVAWATKGKRGPSEETLEHRQQATDDKAARDREAFASLRSHAEEEALRLQRQQIGAYGEGAELDRQAIDLERDRLNAAALLGATTRRWSQAEAEGLVAINDRNALLKKHAVDQAELSHQLETRFAGESHARDNRDALLQIDLDMATTRRERLDLERQLLADAQAERRAKLERIALDPKSMPEDATRAADDLVAAPEREARERQQLARRYQSPMDQYRSELEGSVGDMGEALQGLEVSGLKGFESNLDSVIDKSKTAAQAVKGMVASMLTDLVHLAEEKLILSFLGLSGGGKVQGFAGGGLPGFAGGGDPHVDHGIIRGAGTGTSDSILAMVGRRPIRVANGEGIVTAKGVQKHWPLIDAINRDALPAFAGGGLVDPGAIFMRPLPAAGSLTRASSVQVVKVITEAGPYFDSRVVQTTAPMAQAAMAGGAAQAHQDAADEAWSRIPS